MNQINLLIFWKKFSLGSSERANGSPILSCSDSPWRYRASSLASSWGSSSSIFRTVSAQTMTFFSQCFWLDCSLPCEKLLVLETTRQPWLWLEPQAPCGMLEAATSPQSQLPRPHGHSRHDQRSRSPAPASGRKNDKRNGNACSKSRSPSSL